MNYSAKTVAHTFNFMSQLRGFYEKGLREILYLFLRIDVINSHFYEQKHIRNGNCSHF